MPHIQHRIFQPIGRVWRAWTEVSDLKGWDPDRVDGRIDEGAKVIMHWDSFGVSMKVEVVSCRPEEELRLRVQRPDGRSQDLLVQLEDAGMEGTMVTLTTFGPMSEDERQGTASGWHTQLRVLERYLSAPREDRTSFAAMGPCVSSMERAYEVFSQPCPWLSQQTVSLLEEGQDYTLVTREGLTLTGVLLSLVDGRELALWCNELNGIVRLRAIPLGGGGARLLGAHVVRWGQSSSAMAIQDSLREGVDRLIGLIGGPTGSA